MTAATKGMPITNFRRPAGLVEATVDAHSGLQARAVHQPQGQGAVHRGHRPEAGRQHQGRGCGRRGHRGPLAGGLRRAEGDQGLPRPQQGRGWVPDLAEGQPQLGGQGGQGRTRDDVLLLGRLGLVPERPGLGGPVPAHHEVRDPGGDTDAAAVGRAAALGRADAAARARSPFPAARRPATTDAPARPAVLRQRLTIVAPSPPSPRAPGRTDRTSGWADAADLIASRSAPVPRPWMIVTLSSPARAASSR